MPRRGRARTATIPPPVMGWNTKDPISEMDPLYAVEMENFFPDDGVVSLRNGYRQHATGVGANQVNTIAALNYGAVSKLFAVSNQISYDASAAGAATAVDGGVSLASSRCTTLQFRDRLFIKPYFFSGATSSVYRWTGSGNIAAAAFTGPGGDDIDLLAIGSYKSRIYFGQYTVPSIWYGSVDAVTGALTEFPLTSVLKHGASVILFVGSTTRAKQFAEEELFCVVTDKGEVVIYGGDYPSHSTWTLLGRYQIPRPISERSFFYSGGDLLVATQLGVVSIGKTISGNYEGQWPLISANITSAFRSAFATPSDVAATTTAIAYPKGNYILVSYAYNDIATQFVMNTTTGAWAKFTGQQAYCWAVWDNNLYFGGYDSAKIFKADNGYFDEDPASAGNAQNRTIKLRHAYNYFGDREAKKRFTRAVPYIYQSEGLSLTMDMDVDYANIAATSTETDTSDTDYRLWTPKMGLTGVGKAGSLRIDQTVTTKRMSLQATEVHWEDGDV